MKVILLQDVEGVGIVGDEVEVRPGFARNYLLPKKIALVASDANKGLVEKKKRIEVVRQEKVYTDAMRLKDKLEADSYTILANAGEDDKLFGAVTNADIADVLGNQGVKLNKRLILLEKPVKALGVYDVPIKLHSKVTANLKLWVMKK